MFAELKGFYGTRAHETRVVVVSGGFQGAKRAAGYVKLF
jgi:hypothetical protein